MLFREFLLILFGLVSLMILFGVIVRLIFLKSECLFCLMFRFLVVRIGVV